MRRVIWSLPLLTLVTVSVPSIQAADPFLVFEPHGSAKRKNIVPGLEKQIKAKANVGLAGEYHPTPFGFGTHTKGLTPAAWH